MRQRRAETVLSVRWIEPRQRSGPPGASAPGGPARSAFTLLACITGLDGRPATLLFLGLLRGEGLDAQGEFADLALVQPSRYQLVDSRGRGSELDPGVVPLTAGHVIVQSE